MKYKVIENCYCEAFLHEAANYPRKGLVERKLKKGKKVKHVERITNLYGIYIRVERKGIRYDIPLEKLKPIKK